MAARRSARGPKRHLTWGPQSAAPTWHICTSHVSGFIIGVKPQNESLFTWVQPLYFCLLFYKIYLALHVRLPNATHFLSPEVCCQIHYAVGLAVLANLGTHMSSNRDVVNR